MFPSAVACSSGSPRAAHKVRRLACTAVGERKRVIALYITRVPLSLPLDPLPKWFDEEGQAALDRAEVIGCHHGVEVGSWLTRARSAADTILAVAHECEVEAIFMPLYSWHHPRRRLSALRTARAVTRQALCPVLLGTWIDPERDDPRQDVPDERFDTSSKFSATWAQR